MVRTTSPIDLKDETKRMKWIAGLHGENLFKKIKRVWPPKGQSHSAHYELSLAEMQRMKLLSIQCKLVDHALCLVKGEEPQGELIEGENNQPGGSQRMKSQWTTDLSNYVQAIQEYDYMQEYSRRTRDPFIVSGKRKIDNELLSAAISSPPPADLEKQAEFVFGWESEFIPMVGTRSHSRHSNFLARLTVAAMGAAFLVAPMWLMMIDSGFYTALISTTVFIAVFGFLMACVIDQSKDVMAGTLAYAAVLVVFVGLVRSPS